MDSDVEMGQEINTKDLNLPVQYDAVGRPKQSNKFLRLVKNNYNVRHIKGDGKRNCDHFAASVSDNSVHILDAKTFSSISKLTGHSADITDLTFGKPNGSSTIYSSSTDGTIRCWDLRTAKQISTYQDDKSKLKPIISCDVNCDESIICGGTEAIGEDVFVLLWDKRKPDLLNSFSDSHQDDITQVRFHPEVSATMASGSVDGLINIFNVSEPSDDDAILSTCNTESSVDRICWFKNDKGKYENLALLTHTETVQLWDSNEVSPYKTLSREELAKSFKVSVNMNMFVDCFPGLEQGSVTVLTSSPDGHGFLVDINRTEEKPKALLQGVYSKHIDCAFYDIYSNNVVTADEDGNLVQWKARNTIVTKRKGEFSNGKGKKKNRS